MRINLPVLVLNASFEPLNFIYARRAITMVMNGIAWPEENYEITARSAKTGFVIPSVIRLLEYRRIPRPRLQVSRRNILTRDNNVCQYCGGTPGPSRLTIDHVLPKSRGGEDAWENLVAACSPCNHRKANKLPQEAGMQLRRIPRPVTVHTSRHLLRSMGANNEQWQKYLFYK